MWLCHAPFVSPIFNNDAWQCCTLYKIYSPIKYRFRLPNGLLGSLKIYWGLGSNHCVKTSGCGVFCCILRRLFHPLCCGENGQAGFCLSGVSGNLLGGMFAYCSSPSYRLIKIKKFFICFAYITWFTHLIPMSDTKQIRGGKP